MSWHCLDLRNAEDEDLDHMWRTAWAAAYGDAQPSADNAIFRRIGVAPAMFFSPAAGELAEAFGAAECEPPLPKGLHLVAGSAGSWAACFPGVPAPAANWHPSAVDVDTGQDFQHTQPSMFDESFRPTIPSTL